MQFSKSTGGLTKDHAFNVKVGIRVLRGAGLIFALALFGVATATADTRDEYFQDAMERIAEGDIDGAVIQLSNVVQEDPGFLPGWLELGTAYLKIPNPGAAEHAIVKAQTLGADPEFTVLPLARAYLLQGKVDALVALESPSRLGASQRSELLTLQGMALLETHKLNDARTRFERAAVSAPDGVGHRLGRAMVEMRSGKPELALPLLEEAKRIAPDDPEIHYTGGILARAQSNHESAVQYFGTAIKLAPNHIPAYLGRAATLSDLGRDEEAAADVAVVLAADPDNLQALNLDGRLALRAGRQQEAENRFALVQELISSLPSEVVEEHLPSLMLSAVFAFQNGNYERAADLLNEYLKRFEGHRGARMLLARSYIAMGDSSQARPIVQDLAREMPDDAEVQWLLGTASASRGDNQTAVVALRKARDLGIPSSRLSLQLGAALLAIGEAEEALKFLEEAGAHGGDDAVRAKMMSFELLVSKREAGRALAVAESLISEYPNDASYHNMAASMKLILGRRHEAREQFERAVKLDPKFITPRLNLAEMSRQDNQLDLAEYTYLEILNDDREATGAMRGLAELAVQRGQIQAAIGWLERLRKADPKAFNDRLVLVELYMQQNEVSAAREELRQLRADAPLMLPVFLLSARFEHSLTNTAAARDHLTGATRIALGNPGQLRQVARTQASLGFDRGAINNLNRARALAPKSSQLLVDLAKLKIRAGKLGEAHALADTLVQEFPGSPAGYRVRADAYAKAGKHEAAVAEYEQIVRMAENPANVIRLARAYQAANRVEDGIDTIESWLQEHPTDNEARATLAALLMKGGRFEEAVDAYEMIVAMEPDNVAANNNLALAYDQIGHPDVVQQARRILEMAPDSAAILDTAGSILTENGFLDEGLALLRQAYARDGSVATIKFHLAQALAKKGDNKSARKLLDDALSGPEFEFRASAQKLLSDLSDG